MSRVGNKAIDLPGNVKITIQDDKTVIVDGPKGKLSYKVPEPINVSVKDKSIVVERFSEENKIKALHGLTRSLLFNMVEGVTNGFERLLLIRGVGYRAKKSGEKILISIGYSHTVEVAPVPGIEFAVEGTDRIIVKGIDKHKVGQVAADIRSIRPPDPYKQKGIVYFDEKLKKKMGKAGKVGK